MPFWSRRAAGPLPLPAPHPDGAGFPDGDAVGRPGFAASAVRELALRHAYEVEAHAVADLLAERLLPRLPTGAVGVDAPYLHKVLLTAARVGAGLGMVARQADLPEGLVAPDVAGALLLARRDLPHMPPQQAALAGYVLLAGFAVARGGPEADVVERLLADLP